MTFLPVRPFDESWTFEDAQAFAVALKKRKASVGRSFDTYRSASTPKGWLEANAALRLAGVGHLLWLAQQNQTHRLESSVVAAEAWVCHWNQLFSRSPLARVFAVVFAVAIVVLFSVVIGQSGQGNSASSWRAALVK